MNPSENETDIRATLVGRICWQWSYLEYLFANMVWHLLRLDKPTGMIVTGGLDIRPLCKMAIELSEHCNVDLILSQALKKVGKSLKKEGGLAARRNIIIHVVLSGRHDGSPVMVESPRNKRTRIKQEMTIASIRATLDDIISERNRLLPILEEQGINVH